MFVDPHKKVEVIGVVTEVEKKKKKVRQNTKYRSEIEKGDVDS